MAWARTVAVVVPSPATSLVLLATSRTICAPMFSRLSPSSISLATVTPSLVMAGEPNFLLMTTLRPRGPRVTFTASASTFTPRRIAWRDSSPCTIIFGIVAISYQDSFRFCGKLFSKTWLGCQAISSWQLANLAGYLLFANCFLSSRCAGLFWLFCALAGSAQDSKDLVFLHDQQLFAVNLDFRSGILAEQNAVAFFYCQRNGLALFKLAGSSGDNNAFLGFLFCRVGVDDASTDRLCFLNPADDNAVM